MLKQAVFCGAWKMSPPDDASKHSWRCFLDVFRGRCRFGAAFLRPFPDLDLPAQGQLEVFDPQWVILAGIGRRLAAKDFFQQEGSAVAPENVHQARIGRQQLENVAQAQAGIEPHRCEQVRRCIYSDIGVQQLPGARACVLQPGQFQYAAGQQDQAFPESLAAHVLNVFLHSRPWPVGS